MALYFDMGILEDLLGRVKRFNDGLTGGTYLAEIIQNNDWIIIDYNTQNQLFEQGITATGISIADYAPYSDVTVEIKQMKGQPYDRVTLRDEGDFYRSFYLKIDNEKFEIDAEDWKTRELIKYYGEEIMGLTQENIENLEKDVILPEIVEQARKTLFV